MRQDRTIQASIFDLFAEHEIGHELKAMSSWLDENPAPAALVSKDLPALGRQGEAINRTVLLSARAERIRNRRRHQAR
jgi:IS5 family transposase